jgi:hypothetical protein
MMENTNAILADGKRSSGTMHDLDHLAKDT